MLSILPNTKDIDKQQITIYAVGLLTFYFLTITSQLHKSIIHENLLLSIFDGYSSSMAGRFLNLESSTNTSEDIPELLLEYLSQAPPFYRKPLLFF